MKRGRSTGNPTLAQQWRFRVIQEIGCIACLAIGRKSPAEIHHLTVGGLHGQKRRGHDFTVGLCCYHHRGVAAGSAISARGLEPLLGHSYALNPKGFRAQFGRDDALLARQNQLIEHHTRTAA